MSLLTKSPVETASELLTQELPENTQLTIEETDGRLIAKYILRVTYVSGKSNRKITVSAKVNSLPETKHDETYKNCISQLSLTPKEVAQRFNRAYFMERNARQQAFLFSNDNPRVVDDGLNKDKLRYEESTGV
jgi:hypothetical protein